MRKFHLLLAEWRYQQFIIDNRFYQLTRIQSVKPNDPALRKLFPFLEDAPEEAPEDELDDDAILGQGTEPQGD